MKITVNCLLLVCQFNLICLHIQLDQEGSRLAGVGAYVRLEEAGVLCGKIHLHLVSFLVYGGMNCVLNSRIGGRILVQSLSHFANKKMRMPFFLFFNTATLPKKKIM